MKATAATLDITPSRPCALGANGRPGAHWQSVRERLEANILLLSSGSQLFAVVSFDLLYVGPVLEREIRMRLRHLIPPDHLFLAASHTHTAPATDPDKPLLGVPDPDYLRLVADAVSAELASLIESDQAGSATLMVGSGTADHAINRRRRGRIRYEAGRVATGGTAMGPNPGGPKDETVRRLDLVDARGHPIAVVWNYCCHPTAAPDPLAVGPDFPGAVRHRLRRGEPDLPILFLQGFCGDVKPPAIARFRDMPVRRALMGPRFRLFTPQEYNNWSRSLAAVVDSIPLVPTDPARRSLSARRVRYPASDFVLGAGGQETVSFQHLALGPVRFLGVSAEPVADYGPRLRGSPNAQTWPVGYIDQVFGYAPTRSQLQEGGYEVGGFCRTFACRSVNPRVEDHMLRGFAALDAIGPEGEAGAPVPRPMA